ncbi:MAG: hypothetical protein ACRBBN_06980 [Methyloligellaceae bacterium]
MKLEFTMSKKDERVFRKYYYSTAPQLNRVRTFSRYTYYLGIVLMGVGGFEVLNKTSQVYEAYPAFVTALCFMIFGTAIFSASVIYPRIRLMNTRSLTGEKLSCEISYNSVNFTIENIAKIDIDPASIQEIYATENSVFIYYGKKHEHQIYIPPNAFRQEGQHGKFLTKLETLCENCPQNITWTDNRK